MEKWDNLVRRELLSRQCIEFQQGSLNQKALVLMATGKPNSIFNKSIWKELPEITRSDFSEAAKCLLVGASTPAAMVALRGIEAMVRKYYSVKTRTNAEKKNWAKIVEELKGLPDANQRLLGFIDYVRSEKRNVAQHPARIFSPEEAERIFMTIVTATHDIYGEILPKHG